MKVEKCIYYLYIYLLFCTSDSVTMTTTPLPGTHMVFIGISWVKNRDFPRQLLWVVGLTILFFSCIAHKEFRLASCKLTSQILQVSLNFSQAVFGLGDLRGFSDNSYLRCFGKGQLSCLRSDNYWLFQHCLPSHWQVYPAPDANLHDLVSTGATLARQELEQT